MELILLLAIVIGALSFLLTLYNQLKALHEPIRKMDATLDASLARKRNLSADLRDVASTTARLEVGSVEYVQSSIIKAAEAISASNRPSLLIANLAASFPVLKSIASFERLQETSVSIEAMIAEELEARNRVAEIYNTQIGLFPTVIFAPLLGFTAVHYRNDAMQETRHMEAEASATAPIERKRESTLDKRISDVLRPK